jgi:hypothetical protein
LPIFAGTPSSVEGADAKLGQDCYIVGDGNGYALAYVYFEDEPGRRSAPHLMTRDEARRAPFPRPRNPRHTRLSFSNTGMLSP